MSEAFSEASGFFSAQKERFPRKSSEKNAFFALFVILMEADSTFSRKLKRLGEGKGHKLSMQFSGRPVLKGFSPRCFQFFFMRSYVVSFLVTRKR